MCHCQEKCWISWIIVYSFFLSLNTKSLCSHLWCINTKTAKTEKGWKWKILWKMHSCTNFDKKLNWPKSFFSTKSFNKLFWFVDDMKTTKAFNPKMEPPNREEFKMARYRSWFKSNSAQSQTSDIPEMIVKAKHIGLQSEINRWLDLIHNVSLA